MSFALRPLSVEVMGRKVRTDYSVKESKLVKFLDSGKGEGSMMERGLLTGDVVSSLVGLLRLHCSCITCPSRPVSRMSEILAGAVRAWMQTQWEHSHGN